MKTEGSHSRSMSETQNAEVQACLGVRKASCPDLGREGGNRSKLAGVTSCSEFDKLCQIIKPSPYKLISQVAAF